MSHTIRKLLYYAADTDTTRTAAGSNADAEDKTASSAQRPPHRPRLPARRGPSPHRLRAPTQRPARPRLPPPRSHQRPERLPQDRRRRLPRPALASHLRSPLHAASQPRKITPRHALPLLSPARLLVVMRSPVVLSCGRPPSCLSFRSEAKKSAVAERVSRYLRLTGSIIPDVTPSGYSQDPLL